MLVSLERQVMPERRDRRVSMDPRETLVKSVPKEILAEQDPKGNPVFLGEMARMAPRD